MIIVCTWRYYDRGVILNLLLYIMALTTTLLLCIYFKILFMYFSFKNKKNYIMNMSFWMTFFKIKIIYSAYLLFYWWIKRTKRNNSFVTAIWKEKKYFKSSWKLRLIYTFIYISKIIFIKLIIYVILITVFVSF